MSATAEYVGALTKLKPGDLGILRAHAGRGLDESVDGFDLFAGLWWPLREKNHFAPRRQVAWLIAKLYAYQPITQSRHDSLARQLGRCQSGEERARQRFRREFDTMLCLPLDRTEPALQWALGVLAAEGLKLDWVQLTDDLSMWERESTRLKWTREFLGANERSESC